MSGRKGMKHYSESTKAQMDKQIGELMRDCQKKTRQTYEYRRVQIWLLREFGLVMNHKPYFV